MLTLRKNRNDSITESGSDWAESSFGCTHGSLAPLRSFASRSFAPRICTRTMTIGVSPGSGANRFLPFDLWLTLDGSLAADRRALPIRRPFLGALAVGAMKEEEEREEEAICTVVVPRRGNLRYTPRGRD